MPRQTKTSTWVPITKDEALKLTCCGVKPVEDFVHVIYGAHDEEFYDIVKCPKCKLCLWTQS